MNKRQRKKQSRKPVNLAARVLAFTLTNDRRHVADLTDKQLIGFYKKLFSQKSS